MRVRAPADADAAELVRMVDELNLHEGDPVGHFTEAHARADVIGPDAPVSALVAEGAGGLAGYIFWHFAYETAWAARGGFVSDLYVRPRFRGCGVGRALMEGAARAVAAEGGVFLWLTAYAANAGARRFYARIADIEEEGVVAYAITDEAFRRLARAGAA